MKPHRKRRLCWIIFLMVGVSAGVALILVALKNNINLYYTPSEISHAPINKHRFIRIGGIVKQGSFHRDSKTLIAHFALTDNKRSVDITYQGILPALFREKQGIIVQGVFNQKGIFIANQVLAKHDEKYHPPGV